LIFVYENAIIELLGLIPKHFINILGGKLNIMKKLVAVLLALVAVVALAACANNKTFEIAVVTDVGQLNDGGFNQGTWEGAVNFAKANNKTYKYYQPANGTDAQTADRIAAMELAIENGAKVIVTPGFMQFDALNQVATEHPEVKFVFVDGWNFGLSNVTAISYKEQESGYFAGYAAVKEGYTNLGGTFGGSAANAACNRFAYGYVQGIKAAASELQVKAQVKISFQYGSGFSASPELQTQIAGWYGNGTQVVFSCGGSMLQSVKAAAAEVDGAKIIGVDVDQHAESPAIITSAVKGLTVSVEKVLGEWLNGEWDANLADKTSNLGAEDNSTGLPTNADAWRFEHFTLDEYNALFAKVKAGTVVIDGNIPADASSPELWTGMSDANVTVVFE